MVSLGAGFLASDESAVTTTDVTVCSGLSSMERSISLPFTSTDSTVLNPGADTSAAYVPHGTASITNSPCVSVSDLKEAGPVIFKCAAAPRDLYSFPTRRSSEQTG